MQGEAAVKSGEDETCKQVQNFTLKAVFTLLKLSVGAILPADGIKLAWPAPAVVVAVCATLQV